MRRKSGFILEHLLISMFMIALFLPISVQVIEMMKRNLRVQPALQDVISINQLREILIFSYQIEVNDSYLSFRYQNEIRRLEKVGNRLIMKQGTVIYLTELDDLHFVQENHTIKLYYKRGSIISQRVLCHV